MGAVLSKSDEFTKMSLKDKKLISFFKNQSGRVEHQEQQHNSSMKTDFGSTELFRIKPNTTIKVLGGSLEGGSEISRGGIDLLF